MVMSKWSSRNITVRFQMTAEFDLLESPTYCMIAPFVQGSNDIAVIYPGLKNEQISASEHLAAMCQDFNLRY